MKIKTIALVAFSLLMVLYSCEKDNENYCINNIHGNPYSFELPQSEIVQIKALFEKNSLSYSNLLFFWTDTDIKGRKYVKCFQYLNNLRVLSNSLEYIFDESGNFVSLNGEVFTEINLDTIPTLNDNNVVGKFLSEVGNDVYNKIRIEELKAGCFDVEFGYFQIGPTETQTSKSFVKAWKIHPHNSDYPHAYFDDTSGKTILYTSGIGL